jgi:capsular exopolysaccharide synthesis family protein
MGDKAIDIVDIKEYVGIVLKRKWLVMACFIVCLVAMAVFLMLQPPTYSSYAKIQTLAGMTIGDTGVRGREEVSQYNVIQNAIEVINGEEMLQRTAARVIPKLGLPPSMTPLEARERFIKKVTATGGRGGNTFVTLTVESTGAPKDAPRFAREFANEWANEFLQAKKTQREEEIRRATDSIRNLIHATESKISEAQRELEAYRNKNNLSLLNERINMDSERLMELNQQWDSVRNELIKLEVQRPIIEKDPVYNFKLIMQSLEPVAGAQVPAGDDRRATVDSGGDRRQGAMSPSATTQYFDLQKQRGLILLKLESNRSLYKEKHPVMVELQNELNLLDAQIAQEVQFALERFRTQISVLQAQEQRMKEEIKTVEGRAAETNRKLQDYDILRDNLEAMKKQREEQQKTLDNVIATQIMRSDRFQLQEEARLGVQTGPKFKTGLLLSASFGLGLGIVLAFFIEYVDDSIKVAEEVERDLKLPFLGMVPAAHWSLEDLKTHLLHNLSQQSGISEAYRMVRTAVLFAAPKEKLKVLQLTSAVPLEGKTTTTLNLGIGFAQAGEKVLLIDCDLRRGELHRYFDFQKENGVSEILRGEKTPDEVVRHTEVENLDLITTGVPPPNPAEMLLTPRMKEFLDWARARYDRVFVDCPPAMGISDTAILSSMVDGLVLVVWAGHTSRRFVCAAKDGLLARGANVVGFLLNNLDVGRVGYYYYYPYYYSYYYTYKSEEAPKEKQPTTAEQPEDLY